MRPSSGRAALKVWDLRLIGKEDTLEQMGERGALQETADGMDTQVEPMRGSSTRFGGLFSNARATISPSNLSNIEDVQEVPA